MSAYDYQDPLCSLTPRELATLEEIDRLVKARAQSPRAYTIHFSGATVLGGDNTAIGAQLSQLMKRTVSRDPREFDFGDPANIRPELRCMLVPGSESQATGRCEELEPTADLARHREDGGGALVVGPVLGRDEIDALGAEHHSLAVADVTPVDASIEAADVVLEVLKDQVVIGVAHKPRIVPKP